MKNLLFFLPIAFASVIFFSSCHKDSSPEIAPKPETTLYANEDTTFEDATPGEPTIVQNVGTGKGVLTIDGSKFIKADNYLIYIKGGSYSGITIQNMNNTSRVAVKNNGLVQLVNAAMNLNNVNELTVAGNGTKGITKGFASTNNTFRSIIVNGLSHDLTIKNWSFQNIGDYVIWFSSAPNITYDGTNNTCFYNIKLLNLLCTNTQSLLQLNGNVNNGVFTGMVKNLVIQNVNYSNSNCGDIVFVGDADEYNICHNNIHDINQTNNDHNGIFTIVGNGSFHDNIVDNHQGNAIRAWGVTYGKTPKTVQIYNNTVYNSRKYSGFEVQSFSYLVTPGKSTFVNASITNNLCGNLDLTKDWYGVVVDIYSLFGGSCSVTNNTGFNFPAPNPNNNIYSQQASLVPTASNNHYYSTAAAAGISNVSTLKIY